MRSESIYRYYWFGGCFQYLRLAKEGWRIHGRGHILDNIKNFLDYGDKLNLHVTSRLTKDLRKIQKELTKLANDARLTDKHARRLNKVILGLQKTLEAELHELEAYVLTPKILDINRLVNEVPNLLAPYVFPKLPDIARYDLDEAGKCIAFERPTAAAFHILRGTESVIRHFYCTLVKQKRVSPLLWGPIIDDLRKRRKTKKHEVLYNHLDNIRRSFRNPTQHPEMIYDINEVQNLWSVCTEAINRMIRILE